jgi:hypothetical protein
MRASRRLQRRFPRPQGYAPVCRTGHQFIYLGYNSVLLNEGATGRSEAGQTEVRRRRAEAARVRRNRCAKKQDKESKP